MEDQTQKIIIKGSNSDWLEGNNFFIKSDDIMLFFAGDLDGYRIKNPEEVLQNGKNFRNAVINDINLYLEEGDSYYDKLIYGPVMAIRLNKKYEYHKTAQICLDVEKPFLATEQHLMRFRFYKDDRAYEIYIGTEGNDSTIAFYYENRKKETFTIGRFKNIKITLSRYNFIGSYIVKVFSQSRTNIAAYARLAQDKYTSSLDDAEGSYGAFWKNSVEGIPEIEKTFTEHRVLKVESRWYIPRKYCRVIKRLFYIKAREEQNNLSFASKHSGLISFILSAIGLFGRKMGILMLLGSNLVDFDEKKLYSKMIEKLEDVTKYRFDIESGDNYGNGCYYQLVTEATRRYDKEGTKDYSYRSYFELQPWEEMGAISSPEGEIGTWIDGKDFMKDMESILAEYDNNTEPIAT